MKLPFLSFRQPVAHFPAFLCYFFLSFLNPLSGQNNALHFDGDGDYITLSPIAGWGANTDFTVEAWFTVRPDNLTCNNNFRRLFAFLGPSRFELGQCGGDLVMFWSGSSGIATINTPGVNIEDGNWHCIGVVRNGSIADVYLDGTLIYTTPAFGVINTSLFRVGHWGGGPTGNQDWWGKIDEVKLWDTALPGTQLSSCSRCLLTGTEPNLIAYWQFDQGTPGGNNTGTTQAIDATPNGNHGIFHPSSALPDPGFNLTGPNSNFVSSGTSVLYPNYNHLNILISDPLQTVGLTEICSGDAVSFNLGSPIPLGASVQWEYSDVGFNLATIPISDPIFDDKFIFLVPPNHPVLQADCSTNIGYTDRYFRAIITVSDGQGGTCSYTVSFGPLRICCPLSVPQVIIAPTAICEGDVVTLNVSLNTPDPYVMPPGQTVDIDWCLDGNPIPFHDQTNFSHTVTAGTSDICFQAKITNCAGKLVTATSCVRVDLRPSCGTIQGVSSSLTQVSQPTSPANLAYEICPGDDGVLQATGFTNCILHWQYSFTPTVSASWIDMGTSNSQQNTNILLPAGHSNIFYRVECRPLLAGSPCPPCQSNIIEVREKPVPHGPVLTGNQQICIGDPPSIFSISNPTPNTTYTWLCNGKEIGSGVNLTSFAVNETACYWVEWDDGCYQGESPWLCLAVCEVIPKISCPLVPNDCACLGLQICLSPAGSYNSCGGPLLYTWSWNNGSYQSGGDINGSSLYHIPDPAGTLYTLTVTDPSNGCTATTTYFVKPCDKN